ncbi:hypothetical protein INS49_002991 [Diaporthe citri]|uniref:uncharacterized protein n=1 Tax=Diaporthe citri TaxID=83186 RepID=UPI001C816A92|nr:uncharacterized protein INS49_002991 [Diaporthe citri]KAG6368777.1 hypothetical protein INS49_002991 [Diaporthe citri]
MIADTTKLRQCLKYLQWQKAFRMPKEPLTNFEEALPPSPKLLNPLHLLTAILFESLVEDHPWPTITSSGQNLGEHDTVLSTEPVQTHLTISIPPEDRIATDLSVDEHGTICYYGPCTIRQSGHTDVFIVDLRQFLIDDERPNFFIFLLKRVIDLGNICAGQHRRRDWYSPADTSEALADSLDLGISNVYVGLSSSFHA